MSPRRLSVVLVCALLWTTSVWAALVPYTGHINRDKVRTLSGPGENYYATNLLRQGDEVEVYRVDEGGWCAIRPPESSFSWVAARHLRRAEDSDVAEVVGDNVMVYVGSRIRKDRDVAQVRLNRGEMVRIVASERLRVQSTGQVQTWYRIAPPAGEFRWVHLEYVDRNPTNSGTPNNDVAAAERSTKTGSSASAERSATATATGSHTNAVSTERESTPRHSARPTSAAETQRAVATKRGPKAFSAQWKPLPPGTLHERSERIAAQKAAAQAARRPAKDSCVRKAAGVAMAWNKVERLPAGGQTPNDEPPPQLLGEMEATPISAITSSPLHDGSPRPSAVIATAAADRSESLEQQLAQLDVDFSLMVAKPSVEWQLEPLMLRADSIVRTSQAPSTQARARALLEKIRQFDRLHGGTSPLGAVLVPSAATSYPTNAFRTDISGAAARPPTDTSAAYARPAATPAGRRFPNVLAALDSLMPSAPGQPRGAQPPLSAGAPPPAATLNPLVVAASAQMPETAPPDPNGLSWGVAAEPSVRIAATPASPGAAVGTGTIPQDAAGQRRSTVAEPHAAGDSTPWTDGGSTDVLQRIAGTLLYPLGSGGSDEPSLDLPTATYDGRGWLVPIVARKGGAFANRNYIPPFALTDGEGNILQFVTPAPGVNLHRYVRKEIGVFGQQHPMDHLEHAHVTASRVVSLDRHRR